MLRRPILALGTGAGPGRWPRAARPGRAPPRRRRPPRHGDAAESADAGDGRRPATAATAADGRGEPNILEAAAVAGHLDGRRLPRPAAASSAGSPGSRCSQALHQREEHLEHVLLETEQARNESRAAAGRAPPADGRRPTTRSGPCSTRPASDAQADGRRDRQARPRPRPRPPASAPSARSPRPATRPSPRSGRRRRPGRLGRRPGPRQGARPTTTIAACSTGHRASCPPPGRPTATGGRRA